MGTDRPPARASTSSVVLAPGATFTFTATVSGASSGQSTSVSWTVQEGAAGGTIDANGKYTAPSTEGTYHVIATSVASATVTSTATVTVTGLTALGPDRRTLWNPGVAGGIPPRSTVCKTVDAATYGNGDSDATAGIQAAIDACSAGQVVQLSAGTFTINGGNYVVLNKGITLRGAGAGPDHPPEDRRGQARRRRPPGPIPRR